MQQFIFSARTCGQRTPPNVYGVTARFSALPTRPLSVLPTTPTIIPPCACYTDPEFRIRQGSLGRWPVRRPGGRRLVRGQLHVPRGERVRPRSGVVHVERAAAARGARVPRGPRVHHRGHGSVEACGAAGRGDHGVRADVRARRRPPGAAGRRGLGPVLVHRGPAPVRHQVRGVHADGEHGWHERAQSRPGSVHQGRR